MKRAAKEGRGALGNPGGLGSKRVRYLDGNRLALLTSGKDVYESMWESIDGARETIHLETYIFRADKTGREFGLRLRRKASSGVRVRVIYDAVGSFDLDPVFINRLRDAGVQFLEYHPIVPWRPRWGLNRRDHRKTLIIDGATAFTGGVNISDDHAPLDEGGSDWHDVHVKVEGPAALELDRVFQTLWIKETKRRFELPRAADQRGSSRVWVAANQELLNRFAIRSAYLKALRSARAEVLIANAYFVPDFRTTRSLASAARRNVVVRVLVQGHSDQPWAWHAGRHQFDYLLRHGIGIYEWTGPILHAKAAVVDEEWSAVGSYNLDHRSLLSNLELNLHVLDPDFSKELARTLRKDFARSREIRLEEWRQRPWAAKLAERFWYSFRSLV